MRCPTGLPGGPHCSRSFPRACALSSDQILGHVTIYRCPKLTGAKWQGVYKIGAFEWWPGNRGKHINTS